MKSVYLKLWMKSNREKYSWSSNLNESVSLRLTSIKRITSNCCIFLKHVTRSIQASIKKRFFFNHSPKITFLVIYLNPLENTCDSEKKEVFITSRVREKFSLWEKKWNFPPHLLKLVSDHYESIFAVFV